MVVLVRFEMLVVCPLPCNYINVFNRCSDYEHFGYYCVDFFLCNSDANNTINTSGAGLFEERRVGGETSR